MSSVIYYVLYVRKYITTNNANKASVQESVKRTLAFRPGEAG